MATIRFRMTGYTANCPEDKHAEELERAHRAISGTISSITGVFPDLYRGETIMIEVAFANRREAHQVLDAIKTEIAHKRPTLNICFGVSWPKLQVNKTFWIVSVHDTDVTDGGHAPPTRGAATHTGTGASLRLLCF